MGAARSGWRKERSNEALVPLFVTSLFVTSLFVTPIPLNTDLTTNTHRSFHGVDKMLDQQTTNSTKPSKYATSSIKDQVSPTVQYYHVGNEQPSPNVPIYR